MEIAGCDHAKEATRLSACNIQSRAVMANTSQADRP